LQAQGIETAVVIPRYRSVKMDGARRVAQLPMWIGPPRCRYP
jgi:hypothetical protein